MAITVRLSEGERSRFGAAAGKERLSISEWLRQLGNGACDLLEVGAPIPIQPVEPPVPSALNVPTGGYTGKAVVTDEAGKPLKVTAVYSSESHVPPPAKTPAEAQAALERLSAGRREVQPWSKAAQAGRKEKS